MTAIPSFSKVGPVFREAVTSTRTDMKLMDDLRKELLQWQQ